LIRKQDIVLVKLRDDHQAINYSQRKSTEVGRLIKKIQTWSY